MKRSRKNSDTPKSSVAPKAWKVFLFKAVLKDFENFDKRFQKQALSALEKLQTDPFVIGAPMRHYKFDHPLWRRRVGRLRVIYWINKAKWRIMVVEIDLRDDDTYDQNALSRRLSGSLEQECEIEKSEEEKEESKS